MKFKTFSGLLFEYSETLITGIGKNKKTVHLFAPSPASYVFNGKEYHEPLIRSESLEKSYLAKTYGAIEFYD